MSRRYPPEPAKAGIDCLPMPGGGFGYYHYRTGLANWKLDWRNSWDELRDRLYGRYEEMLDGFGVGVVMHGRPPGE